MPPKGVELAEISVISSGRGINLIGVLMLSLEPNWSESVLYPVGLALMFPMEPSLVIYGLFSATQGMTAVA